MIIKWINKYSREEGFVKSVDLKQRHFNNTFDKAEAKVYGNKGAAAKVVKALIDFGEGENNDFEIVSA